jgi:hypothetical protein
MNIIWGFGDSFTFGHGCRIGGPLGEYCLEYKKDGDKLWLQWVAERMSMKSINMGECGISNDIILDKLIASWKDITEGDIVVIGYTFWGRREVPFEGRWLPLMTFVESMGTVLGGQVVTEKERLMLVHYQHRFGDDILWKERGMNRFSFVIDRLKEKGVRVLEWNVTEKGVKACERIGDVSQYEDGHFSFGGHKQWGEVIYNRLNPTTIPII